MPGFVAYQIKAYPNGFQKDFITHYVDPQEALAKINALATEFPNIAKVIDILLDHLGVRAVV